MACVSLTMSHVQPSVFLAVLGIIRQQNFSPGKTLRDGLTQLLNVTSRDSVTQDRPQSLAQGHS